MNLSRTDATILVVYAVFAVIAGFVFPMMGMTGPTEQTQSDVPEFNLSQTRFDFVGDLPEYPSEPSSGVLNHSSDKFDEVRGSIQIELGPGDNGNRIFLVAINETTVHLTDVEASTINDSVTFTADGQTKTLDAYGFEIDVHSVDISANAGEYEWIMTESPNNSDVPLIGGVIDTADAVANGIFWIGSTIVVLVLIVVEGAANLGGIMFDVITFFVDLGAWMVSVYTPIVTNAPGYAQVLLAVIGLPLYYVFGKVSVNLINMVNPFG